MARSNDVAARVEGSIVEPHVVADGQTEYDLILWAHTGHRRPPAPSGYWYYLPEEHYFIDTPEFPKNLAYRVTARALAPWADRYWAGKIPSCGMELREGPLAGFAADRMRAVDAVFEWFDEVRAEHDTLGLVLYAQDQVLADWSDGFPSTMLLTGARFRSLRRAWRAHGLPDDLCHRASARRTRMETRLDSDGVAFRARYFYSPRRWPLRPRSTGDTIKLPSDADITNLLPLASLSYYRALVRMVRRLQGSDAASDKELLEAVEHQIISSARLVRRACKWADSVDTSTWDPRTAEWYATLD